MAIGDIGIFNPSEGQYKAPGAYDEALRADALKRAAYLSMMDQFYEQLDETKREFDATSTYKYAALAQEKWATEQQIGLSKEDLALRRELGTGDLALRTRALEEQSKYNAEALDVERMKINSARPANYLGSGSASDKAFAFLNKLTTTGGAKGNYYSVEGTRIEPLSITGASSPAARASSAPQSGAVDYGSFYTPTEMNQMDWL